MKKFLKITGIVLGVILILLIAAPIVFESQLEDLVKKTINRNVNARVEFDNIDLTLFRSFPKATLVLNDVSLVNNAPFEGDTLARGKEVLLTMSIGELFKGSDKPKKLEELRLNEAFVNLKIDSLGRANYDIALKDSTATTPADTSGGFSLDLQHYEINNSRLKYDDRTNDISLELQDLDHSGTGDFSLDQTDLKTHTNTLISLNYGGTNYLDKNKLALDAVIQMDLQNLKYTFLENEATINQLPLTFDGYVKVNDNNTEMDLSFKTPSSDFKNFLQVMPEEYAKNIENVETHGDFVVNGEIKGVADEQHIPKMDIKISSDNASFKYPDLPKSVQDINIDMEVLNKTGIADDTYMTFDNVTFRIDQDRFATHGSIHNLTGNMLVSMALNGTINLANLSQAYPLDLEQDLNGILTADLSTTFDMNSIEKEQYQNVKSQGTATVRNFSYKSPQIPNEIKIANANLNFNQGNVQVPELLLTTGQTDMKASGTIQNLMGFLFTDQDLKGNFRVNSNTFAVSDFMVAKKPSEKTNSGAEKKPAANTSEEAIKIPSFLDTRLDFNVNRVLYDNLVLNNTKGTLIIKDETATLQNVTSNIFNGGIALNGQVSTRNPTPTFQMDLDLNQLDIASSFNGLELLQNLAPVAKALQGKLQTNIKLKGNLHNDLTPNLASLTGNALAEILTAKINPEQLPLLANLDQQLKFIDLSKLNLDDLKTQLTFADGMVKIQPFDFKVKDIDVQVSGSHGFDMQMNYDLKLDVPAKYLGSEVGGALGKLTGEQVQNMSVALPIGLTGTFQDPRINLNMQQAISNLTQQIVQKQKEKLIGKGEEAIKDIITQKTGGKTDTTKTQQKPQTRLPDITDTTKTTDQKVQEAAKNILGGILKNAKKKKDTTNKKKQ